MTVTAAPPAGPAPRPVGGATRLAAFFGLAYALSWAWVVPLAATGQRVSEGRGWPTHLPSLVAPLVAAFAVTVWTEGRTGVRDLLSRMTRWRIGWRWWLAATSPLAFLLVALPVLALAGQAPGRADFARFSGVTSALGPLGVGLVIMLVNGFGEETGWRGYALPQLQRRLGPVAATAVLSALWAAWHLPQFFLLRSFSSFSAPMLPVWLLGLFAGALVMTWLYNRTGGSILAVAVFHGLYNVAGATRAASAGSGVLAAAVWTFVVVVAVVLLGAERRAHRAGGPSVLGRPDAQEPGTRRGPAPGVRMR